MTKIEDLYPLMLEAFANGQTFTFPIKGTSMNPLLKTNDTVKIKDIKDHKIKKGDITLHRREDGSFILHRIRRVKKSSFDIVGDHQTKLEKNVLLSQIIGVVVSYKKNGKDKEYKLKGFKYFIYKRMVRIPLIRFIFSKR